MPKTQQEPDVEKHAASHHVHGDHCNHDLEEIESVPFVRGGQKVGRNDPCPCHSGKKFKKCCAGLSS